MAQELYARPVVRGIVQAGNTDGYAVVDQFADGSESTAWGWFSSRDAVYARFEDEDVEIQDWTGEDDEA